MADLAGGTKRRRKMTIVRGVGEMATSSSSRSTGAVTATPIPVQVPVQNTPTE
jgi:hypothetical protein